MKPHRLGHIKASGSWSQVEATKGSLEPYIKVWSSQEGMMAPLQWGDVEGCWVSTFLGEIR